MREIQTRELPLDPGQPKALLLGPDPDHIGTFEINTLLSGSAFKCCHVRRIAQTLEW